MLPQFSLENKVCLLCVLSFATRIEASSLRSVLSQVGLVAWAMNSVPPSWRCKFCVNQTLLLGNVKSGCTNLAVVDLAREDAIRAAKELVDHACCGSIPEPHEVVSLS